ncbi:hypothetical protein ABZX95_06150 [Streptomyces sp. NPDC004232]|uniref:hypothetical protein n=1 Tax=Streptomyces sp. NPDC004232 TaxID=3154454 RepID=UPI0033AA0591
MAPPRLAGDAANHRSAKGCSISRAERFRTWYTRPQFHPGAQGELNNVKLNRKRATIAGVVAFCVVSVIYRAARPDASTDDASRATPTATTATRHPSPSTHAAAKRAPKPEPTPQPTDVPRLDRQGDGLQGCVIRYRAGDDGTTGWVVFASRRGMTLVTATTLTGKTYEKTWYADTDDGKTAYVTSMDVPVPLTDLRSVDGVLNGETSNRVFRCLVGPGA